MILYISYLIISLILAAIITRQATNRIYTALLTFWMFTQPVFFAFFTLKIPGLDVDMNINRAYFFLFMCLLFFSKPSAHDSEKVDIRPPAFSVYGFLIILSLLISVLANLGNTNLKSTLSIILDIFIFIIFHLTARRFSNESSVRTITKAILILMTISSMLAFPQFFGGGKLFNLVDYDSTAFGPFKRAMGVFHYEYHHGYMLNLAIVILLIMYKRLTLRLFPLFSTAILLVFHRLNMLVYALNSAIYFLSIKRRLPIFATVTTAIVAAGLLLAIANMAQINLKRTTNVESMSTGLFHDTISGRLKQYEVTFDILTSNPLGLGISEVQSPEYRKMMKKHGMVTGSGQPLYVHNGYLELGINYGAIPVLVYIIFLIYLMTYYIKRAKAEGPIYYVPFFSVLILAIGNLTNGSYNFYNYYSLMVATITGLFSGPRLSQDAKPRATVQ